MADNTITAGRERYLKTHPVQAINDFQLAMNDSVEEVIKVCETENIDADILRGGEFEVAYTPAQEHRLRAQAEADQAGSTDVRLLEAAEAQCKISVAGTRAALWHPHAARIQPAKLVRGLAQARVERLGVKIYEDTPVRLFVPVRLISQADG